MAATNAQHIARNKELWTNIEKRIGEFEEIAKTSVPKAVEALYSEKYKGIDPTGNTQVGRSAAAEYLGKEDMAGVKTRIDEVSGEGEYAYVRGTFKSPAGNGKYLTVWKREADQKLFVYNECWNFSK